MSHKPNGFTLTELLISVAITGVIVAVLGTSIWQVINISEVSAAKLQAAQEVQNAGHWFAFDGQMAKTATGGAQLNLTMPDSSTVTYALSGDDLRRTSGSSVLTLAQNVTSLSFSIAGRVITMNITSTPPGRTGLTAQTSYRVTMRPAP